MLAACGCVTRRARAPPSRPGSHVPVLPPPRPGPPPPQPTKQGGRGPQATTRTGRAAAEDHHHTKRVPRGRACIIACCLRLGAVAARSLLLVYCARVGRHCQPARRSERGRLQRAAACAPCAALLRPRSPVLLPSPPLVRLLRNYSNHHVIILRQTLEAAGRFLLWWLLAS